MYMGQHVDYIHAVSFALCKRKQFFSCIVLLQHFVCTVIEQQWEVMNGNMPKLLLGLLVV